MLRTLLALIALTAALPAPLAAATRDDRSLPRKLAEPLEVNQGLETLYTSVRMPDRRRLRVILTRPEGAVQPMPAVFFTQEVVCETVEFPAQGMTRLKRIARSVGLVLVRVERSGSGDSEGPGCDKLDYDTEVSDYREAFRQLSGHAWVDPGRIVIYGSSLGSTVAPLVAQGNKVAGVVVQGGGAVSYLERMIGFDRLHLERSGKYRPDQVQTELLRRIRFQQHYLLERKTPAQVVAEHPDLTGVWESLNGTSPDLHYTRTFAWHWQAASRDFLAAWAQIEAPVMVIYGEFEQFEMRHGHRLIVDIINAKTPGRATWLEIPAAGHDLRIYPDPVTAYTFEGGQSRPELSVTPMIAWIRQVTGSQPSR
jgi:pimeloyl-ACP methyl ester carboxylesterase